MNGTWSFPLNQPWTNATVNISAIDNGHPPSSEKGAFWTDNESKFVYKWGGSLRRNVTAADPAYWKLTIGQDGDATWSEGTPVNQDVYNSIRRRTAGVGLTCGNYGLYIGGMANPHTDANPPPGYGSAFSTEFFERIITPDLVMFDMRNQTWAQDALPAEFSNNTLLEGAAVCITGFGADNLVAVLGGALWTPIPEEPGKFYKGLRSFEQLLLYDTTSRQWHTQTTFGDVPVGRWSFCAVGVRDGDVFNM